ncbi:MAG TPA: sigma-70 family RNA polymerase sigma factor [Chloroflexota bacterium]|jgi:RNA polymerase sigma-70 factor (ECF subfamily)
MPPQPSDQELLAAISRGDQAALGQLYDRYAAAALGTAFRVVQDRAIAEEVVKDAFVAAWRRVGSYEPERADAGGWLLSIVHRRAIDRRRGRAEPEPVATAADESDLRREALSRRQRAEIVAALEALPAEQREAIELAFFGGLTHVEIAERTGHPSATIKGRMRLGLIKLRTVLQGREVEPRLE